MTAKSDGDCNVDDDEDIPNKENDTSTDVLEHDYNNVKKIILQQF